MTRFQQDLIDLFVELNGAEARYLIVGAHAVIHYAGPRYTKDLDLWTDPTRANAPRVWSALKSFGAPLAELSEDDLVTPGLIFQMGQPPVRVDIMTSVEGLEFASCWQRAEATTFGGVPVRVLHLDDLLINKRAVARPQDLLDVERLEKAKLRPKA